MVNTVGRIFPDSTPGCVIWRVEDFFSYPQNRDVDFIEGPGFDALDAVWWLCVHPSVNIDGTSRTRLSLWSFHCNPPFVARFQFGILGRDDTELIAYSGEAKIERNHSSLDSVLPANWRQDREKFAPGGVLSVFCRLRKRGATRGNDTSTQTDDLGLVFRDSVEEPSKSCSSPGYNTSTQTEDIGQVCQGCVDGPSKSYNSPGPLKVLENLKELLSTEEVCDVTLKVQNQEIKAHKALLVARSSVFKAMFCHEMSEKLSNEVHISDCDPDAFRIFLRHVYTGDAEGLSMSNAFDVFFVANKYDAAELKIQCKDCIANSITEENVCDVVAFSLLHSDSVLLELASEFFTKNFSQILLTNKWQCFFREHATAANELLIRVSKFYVPPQ